MVGFPILCFQIACSFFFQKLKTRTDPSQTFTSFIDSSPLEKQLSLGEGFGVNIKYWNLFFCYMGYLLWIQRCLSPFQICNGKAYCICGECKCNRGLNGSTFEFCSVMSWKHRIRPDQSRYCLKLNKETCLDGLSLDNKIVL